MNQSSQVFKGYVCLLSYASVVGHGFLSRHLIASHWDFALFQNVKELFNNRLLYAIISLTIRELTLLLSHMQDSNLLRYEPLNEFLCFILRQQSGMWVEKRRLSQEVS
jgi:hypothetical protein